MARAEAVSTRPCVCGGSITAPDDDPGPAVLDHAATSRHALWRLANELPELTPIRFDALRELFPDMFPAPSRRTTVGSRCVDLSAAPFDASSVERGTAA